MICLGCGESYNEDMFPVCPYCLQPNIVETTEPESQNVIVDDITGEIDDFVSDEKLRCSEMIQKKTSIILDELFETFIKPTIEVPNVVKSNATVDCNPAENRLLIKNVFFQNKFNLFVRYCTANGIQYVDELDDFDFSKLNNVRGMGEKKIEEITKHYIKICDKEPLVSHRLFESNKEKIIETENKPDEDNLNSQELNINISNFEKKILIKDVFFQNRFKMFVRYCDANKIQYFDELDNFDFSELNNVRGFGEKKIEDIITHYRNVSGKDILHKNQNPELTIQDFELYLTKQINTNKYNATLFKANGFTLQEIGELLGVTRERARQLINSFTGNLKLYIQVLINSLKGQKNYIALDELIDVFDNDDFNNILVYCFKNSDQLNYFEVAEVFLLSDIDLTQIANGLLQFAEELVGDGMNLTEHYAEIEDYLQNNDLNFMTVDIFISFLQQNNYKKYGTYITKGRQSYAYICSKVIAQKFPSGIKLYDNAELNLLRHYVMQECGDIGLSEDDRALSSRIADYTVLSGRGKVTAEENIHVELYLLEEIKAYIDSKPEAHIYYSEIYNQFEGLISMMSNIDNHHFLHGVLKLYYPDEYSYGRDYLTKTDGNYVSGHFPDRIARYIIELKQPISRTEMKKKFSGLSDAMLWNILMSDEDLILWEYNSYYLLSLMHFSSEMQNQLKQLLQCLIDENNGYCSERLLYKKVKEEMPAFIEYNSISKPEVIYHLCSKIYRTEFDFRRPHITSKGLLETINVKNIVLHYMGTPDTLLFSEYQKITDNFIWPDATAGIIFSEIEEDYIRISNDCYIKREVFDVSNDVIDRTKEVIKNNMQYEFVSLQNIEFKDQLPQCKYEWNEFLLHSLVDNFMPEFKVIGTKTKDRRYERGIIVYANSSLNSYEDIVISLMRSENISHLPESKMLSFLIINNLTYKMLPKELYEGNELKFMDGAFYLT